MVKLYNTLTRSIETLKPISEKKLNIFVCGPTVYDFSHIGHAKSYVQFDVIVRYLKYRGFDVFYLQNITDIDDKIINRAKEEGNDPQQLAKQYEQEYYNDMKSLNVTSVTKYARATDFIPQIINQIKKLQGKNIAYEIDDGIYFDISKFQEYGKLSKQDIEQLKEHRIEVNPQKRNSGDFSLWKKQKPGEPSWDSPFGEGRPGWHIEDTAITEHHFGPSYDIHGGGIDLIFPHHEAEIAQMESLTSKPLSNFWLHNGFLLLNNAKMSKSLNNVITIQGAIEKWGAQPLRFLFATSHYRAQINFTEDSITAAISSIKTLKNTVINAKAKLIDASSGDPDEQFLGEINEHKNEFLKEMDTDFNAPNATAALFGMAHDINVYNGNKETFEKALSTLIELTNILGLVIDEQIEAPQKVQDLIKEREWARSNNDWDNSDKIREEIKKLGFWVDDTPTGPVIKKL